MSKLTRTALKSIVKECLVELLSEGLSVSSQNNNVKKIVRKRSTGNAKNKKAKENFDERINKTVSAITSDNMMQEILADTAKTTLQEQLSHDQSSGLSQPASPMLSDDSHQSIARSGIDLTGIFGSEDSNWSQLAFADKKR